MGTWTCVNAPNPIFFLISCLFFKVLFSGTGWQYFFFWLLWRQIWEIAPLECLRRLENNFKKTPNMGTWTCVKAPNPFFFFNFVLIFWGVIRWNRLTIFFFCFFDVQTWEIAPLDCLRQLAHNLKKKPRTWVLEHVWRLQILFF